MVFFAILRSVSLGYTNLEFCKDTFPICSIDGCTIIADAKSQIKPHAWLISRAIPLDLPNKSKCAPCVTNTIVTMFVGLWFKALNFNITFRTGGRSTFPPWHYLQILYINFILSAMLLRNSKSRKKILNTLDVAAALHFICTEKPIEWVHFVILLQIQRKISM